MALSSSQIASRLFKKSVGAGETLVTRQFFEEPKLGKDLVFTSQIWSQSDLIPTSAPSLAPGASAGVVQYFQKETLSHVSGSTNLSYYSANLIDSIPFNFGNGTYNYTVYKNDGTTVIAFGEGDWLVDNTSGLLTFYGTLPSGVSEVLPPKISFYKYVGTKGFGSGSGIGTILGVTAGNGLSGGGTQGAVTLNVNLGVNSGLTFSGDDIILDTNISGNGLDFSSGILSVNTSEITSTLAGIGLTSNGSSLDINFNSITGTGLTQNGNLISIDTNGFSSTLAGDGLSSNGGTLSVNTSNGITIISDSVQISDTIAGTGLTFSSGVLSVNTSDITNSLAGNGLTANGSTLDVNVNSDSLEILSDVIRLKDTITGDRTFQNNFTIGGDLFVQGSFSVAGSSSVINTTTLVVNDPIIALGHSQSGSPILDEGIMFVRGTGLTQAFIWDESEHVFALVGTNDDHTLIGNVTIDSYSNLRLSGLTSSKVQITDGAQQDYVLVSDSNGVASWTSSVLKEGTGLTKSGTVVSLDFESITGTGLTQNGSVINIDTNGFGSSLAGDGLSSNGGTLSVNVGNGLEIISDVLQLGGTLSQNTTINGGNFDLTIQNFDVLALTGSSVDVQLDNGVFLVDVGDGSIDFYSSDTIIYATVSVDIITTGDFSISTGTGSVTTSNSEGLVYTSDYSGTFVTNSLITKKYVDSGTSSIWQAIDSINNDYITGITAGDGLSGGGTFGFITLDVNLGLDSGLTFSGDDIVIDSNIAGNGLDFSTGILTVNTSEITTTLSGNGLIPNGSSLDVDFNSITGTGLTQNGSVISIDTTGFASDIAGDGLIAVGGTLSVNVGLSSSTGLTVSSDILQLSTTGVTAGSYGSSMSIPTFTVDSQGRLTNAGTVSLDLSSGSSAIAIGPAEDGSYTDGIFTDFTPSTPIGTAIDRFNEMFLLLAPTPPGSWAGSITSISFTNTSYSPRSLTTGVTVSRMFTSTTPTLTNIDSVSTQASAKVDTTGYTFSLVDNGVIVGTATLSGTYTVAKVTGNIQHSASVDPYIGVAGQAGFWKGITSFAVTGTLPTITPSSSLRILELYYPNSGYVTYSYYIDSPLTPSITSLTASIPAMTSKISGVPTLTSSQNITSVGFNIPNVSSYFYAPSYVWSVAANLVNSATGDPDSIPASNGETGVVSGRTLAVANNVFSDTSFSFTVTPRNSTSTSGTPQTLTTNFYRVDTKSNESSRLLSGSGNYPSVGYGVAYDSTQSLLVGSYSTELQLKNATYQYPTVNYTNFGGPNYSTATGIRWATFNLGTFTGDSTFTLNIVGGTNISSNNSNANFYLEVKIEGVTRWVDGDSIYPLVGNPGGGVSDGDPAVVFADSTAYSRKITFGAVALSGSIIARIGFTSATNITFTSLTATNIS